MMNEMVLERTSNLVMPLHYVELDRDEMSYIDGGYFIGIDMTASFCMAIANYVPLTAKTGGIGLGALGSIAMGVPQIKAIPLF